MTLQSIDPKSAQRLVDEGALLVDIREADEFARERLPGAHNRPLAGLTAVQSNGAKVVIFHCKSGRRTQANAQRLVQATDCEAYLLEGGLEAWKKAGLPMAVDARQPLEIMRQVHIATGSLILLGVVLGTLIAPVFYGLSAFIGAGLLFAGISGVCGMAKVLAFMPWNRRAVRAAAADGESILSGGSCRLPALASARGSALRAG